MGGFLGGFLGVFLGGFWVNPIFEPFANPPQPRIWQYVHVQVAPQGAGQEIGRFLFVSYFLYWSLFVNLALPPLPTAVGPPPTPCGAGSGLQCGICGLRPGQSLVEHLRGIETILVLGASLREKFPYASLLVPRLGSDLPMRQSADASDVCRAEDGLRTPISAL